MKYYRRKWSEKRGDQFDEWGTITFYLAVDPHFNVTSQLEIYENGQALKYDTSHLTDQYGALADQPLDTTEFVNYEIEETLFWQAWHRTHGLNR